MRPQSRLQPTPWPCARFPKEEGKLANGKFPSTDLQGMGDLLGYFSLHDPSPILSLQHYGVSPGVDDYDAERCQEKSTGQLEGPIGNKVADCKTEAAGHPSHIRRVVGCTR